MFYSFSKWVTVFRIMIHHLIYFILLSKIVDCLYMGCVYYFSYNILICALYCSRKHSEENLVKWLLSYSLKILFHQTLLKTVYQGRLQSCQIRLFLNRQVLLQLPVSALQMIATSTKLNRRFINFLLHIFLYTLAFYEVEINSMFYSYWKKFIFIYSE